VKITYKIIPIPNVKVKVKNTNIYTYTNTEGRFRIKNIEKNAKIELCYEHEDYSENYCLNYKREGENIVHLPK